MDSVELCESLYDRTFEILSSTVTDLESSDVFYLDDNSSTATQRAGFVVENYISSMELGGYLGDLHIAYATPSKYAVISPATDETLFMDSSEDAALLTGTTPFVVILALDA
jgi:hypothetical protein